MSNMNDFVIENGVLKKYVGQGGDVVIPDSVTSIGSGAFSWCSSLTSVTIPDSVTSIGSSAFWQCNSLTSVTIPDSVTSIGDDAFYNCGSLTSVTIPDSVTSIGYQTFYGCSSLTSVTIPDSVTSIGNRAFDHCRNLTSVTIPDSVTSIGWSAFYSCKALKNISFPDSLLHVGVLAFADTAWYDSLPEGIVYIGKVVYKFKGSLPPASAVVLKDDTVSISESAFDSFECRDSIITVSFPPGLKEIGKESFQDCRALRSVDIPENVKIIGENAFKNCSGLRSVTCAQEWESAFYLSGVETEYLYGDFELDGILNKIVNKKIQAKKKVFFTEIIEKNNGSAMAKYLGAWKKVPISTLDEYINKASAQNSTEVVAVLMEYKNKLYSTDDVAAHETKKTEQELGMRERSFREWQKVFKLTEAYVDNGLIIAKYRGEDAVVEIPERIGTHPVLEIGKGAFAGCKHITSVSIPASVRFIDERAFENCVNLKTLILPEALNRLGDLCFVDCKGLINQQGLVIVNHVVFYSDKELEQIEIPDDVFEIGMCAFEWNYNLKSITIPGTIKTIGVDAFNWCKALETVVIEDGTKKIKRGAFRLCESLKTITIPESVTSIERSAFELCKDFVIQGKAKSYAQKYAKRKGYPFVEI